MRNSKISCNPAVRISGRDCGVVQESTRLLTRRSARPSLDLDSVVSLARADSALSIGTCLAKAQCLKLQRGSEGARSAGARLPGPLALGCLQACWWLSM